jgi:signal transduction histidine kinase
MQPMFVKSQVQVKLDIPNIHAKALIVPDELQQVFINLLDNSIFALEQKYPRKSKSPNKKYIKISLSNKKLMNNGDKSQEYAKISFFDDGTGIARKNYKKIFEPFFSTKKSKANLPEEKKYQGMGLGLAYCKSIVSKYKGFIEFESEKGKYTIFDVYLPLTKKTEELEQEVRF